MIFQPIVWIRDYWWIYLTSVDDDDVRYFYISQPQWQVTPITSNEFPLVVRSPFMAKGPDKTHVNTTIYSTELANKFTNFACKVWNATKSKNHQP